MRPIKRIFTLLLTVLMLLSALPLSALKVNAASSYLWPVINGTANKHGYGCRCGKPHQGNHYGQDISGSAFGEAILSPIDGVISDVKTGCRGKSNYEAGKSCTKATCSPNQGFGSKESWKGLKFCNGGSGNGVTVKDPKTGISFSVAHMAYDPVVKSGQTVKKGQVLGYVGETGCSAGIHLHFTYYNKNGKTRNPMSLTYAKPKTTAFASTLTIDGVRYPKNKKAGETFSVSGVVSSNVKITSVALSVVGPDGTTTSFGSAAPNAYSYDLHKLDGKAQFKSLKTHGTYTYKVVAKDAKNRTLTFSKTFTVNAKATTAAFGSVSLANTAEPTVQTTNFVGGVKVSLACATAGAKIYYSTDGSTPTVPYNGAFDLTKTTKLRFYAAKSGLNASEIQERTLTVDRVATPQIITVPTETGYSVTLSCGTSGAAVYYTTDGTTPTASSTKYTGSLSVLEQTTVKAIALKSGMANSEEAEQSLDPVAPNAPSIRLLSLGNLGIGDALQLEWDPVPNAAEYDVTVTSDGGIEKTLTTQGTVAAITLDEADTYRITVKASNAFGDSGSSNTLTAVVHGNVTVTFVNDDGSLISSQSVKYGGHAVVPVAPAKTGHSFTGWQGIYTYVTEDSQVTAEYIPNQYQVTFVDSDGNVLKSKYIDYGQAFGSEDIPVLEAATGYRFVGWAVKSGEGDSYECVNGDVVFEPIFVWSNDEVPLGVSIERAERKADSTGYTLDVLITNISDQRVAGKLICVIKTSYDQMLVTEITNISIEPLAQDVQMSVSIPCTGVGKLAQAYIVANDENNSNRTGGAYSVVATKEVTREESETVTYWGEWSQWQTEAVTPSDTVEVESKIQYSYRDKETTTGTAATLDGWTQSGSSTAYGSWSAWSSWSLTAQTASDVKGVETRQVYYYFHYCDGSGRIAPSTSYSYGKYGPHTLYSTTKLTVDRTSSTGYTISDGETKCSKNCGSYYYGGVKTQYRYRTRTKTTTYSFWRWGEWSQFDDALVIATDNKQVQSRTVYRYRSLVTESSTSSSTDIGTEPEKSGTEYTVAGHLTNVSQDYSGKLATVMVYKEKNIDPTEEQMQYMTQITIGQGNTYSFTFLPKDEISAETGDYIISFGIANADGLINNIERIEAPKQLFDVTFKSFDGTIIETQKVEEGADAVEPMVEVPEGYELRWNRTLTNITRSVEITALTKAKTYTVVFIDWANSSIVKISPNVAYGSQITFPEDPVAEGKTFTGWSLNEGSTVSDTVVIEAQYEDILKTVEFLNRDGSVYFSTQVPYGSHAELPDTDPTAEGCEFLAWSHETGWWNVKEDVKVEPIFVYAQTAETPVIIPDPDSTLLSFRVEMETATAHADIRYTLDGSEPTQEDPIFTGEPIVVHETTVLKAKAFHPEMNASATAQILVEGIAQEDIPAVCADGYELAESSVTVNMRLENPRCYRLKAYGYLLSNGEGETWTVRDTSAVGSAETVLDAAFTVEELQPDTYGYTLFAEFEEVGTVVSDAGTFTIEDPAADHDHSYIVQVTQAAACTRTGTLTYTCELCDDSYTEATAPIGHIYSNGICSLCGKAHSSDAPSGEYYLFGFIDNGFYGMEEENETMGAYRLVEGALTVRFNTDSHVAVKTPDGTRYMTDGTDEEETAAAVLYNNPENTGADMLYVPGDTEVTFTLTENADGSLTLSYVAAEKPVTQPTLKLRYPTVSFEDVIMMNVYFAASELEDVVDMGLITYSSEVSQWNVDNAEEVIPGYGYNESEQLYYATTNGISAKCLGDTIWFAVYAELSDGTYSYTKLVSYSPETYAYALLQTGAANIKPIVVAMLKYGAAAQAYFSYNTESLVDRNLTADQLALAEGYRADMMDAVATPSAEKEGAFAKTGGYARRYPTVSFEGAFSINYYYTPSYEPAGAVTMYYWSQEDFDAAQVLTAENATAAVQMEGEGTGEYAAAVEGVPAKHLDKGIYVAFVYSDGTTTWSSGVLAYSIGTYCTVSAAGGTSLAPLAEATAVYSYCAKQLFS